MTQVTTDTRVLFHDTLLRPEQQKPCSMSRDTVTPLSMALISLTAKQLLPTCCVSASTVVASATGVRIPDSEFIRAVCHGHGGAIALTSANTSGGTSPLSVNDFMHLWPLCAAVFNGKRIQADRAGSTIVELSAVREFRIIRPGVSKDTITSLLLENGLRQKA